MSASRESLAIVKNPRIWIKIQVIGDRPRPAPGGLRINRFRSKKELRNGKLMTSMLMVAGLGLAGTVPIESGAQAEPSQLAFDCPFHKLELYEIGELPATRMLWSSSRRTF